MAPLPGYKANVYVSGGASTPQSPIAMTDSGDHQHFNVTNSLYRYLDPGVPPTVQVENDEIQTISVTGSPTGGTFTLTFGGQTTSALNWNATASQMQTALQALSSIGANAIVSGGPAPGTAFTVEFTGTLGFASQALITLQTNSLTGGTSPSVSITRAQAGQGYTTTTGYTIQFCGGVVTLSSALLGTVNVQLLNGAYFAVSQALQAKSVELQTAMDVADITSFASAQASGGWKTKQILLGDSTWKISQWWLDNPLYIGLLGQLLVMSAYSGANANQRYESYAYLKGNDIKIDVKAIIEQALDLESSGPVFYIAS